MFLFKQKTASEMRISDWSSDVSLPIDHGFLTGRDLREVGAAAGTGGRMEIDGMHHDAVGGILEMNIDGIADPDAHERARNLAIEGPVDIGQIGKAACRDGVGQYG